MKLCFAVLSCAMLGCGGTTVPSGQPSSSTGAATVQDPEQRFSALEERLLRADRISFRFEAEARGAVEVDISGTVEMGRDEYQLLFEGSFSGQNVTPTLSLRDGVMSGGSDEGQFEDPAPEGLREAVVLGMTRMGLLHNVATLAGGRPPDRSDGTARMWLTVSDLDRGAARRADDREAVSIDFAIQVGGEPSADATLYFDPGTGLPFRRDQVVHFERGDMRVVERYSEFVVTP